MSAEYFEGQEAAERFEKAMRTILSVKPHDKPVETITGLEGRDPAKVSPEVPAP